MTQKVSSLLRTNREIYRSRCDRSSGANTERVKDDLLTVSTEENNVAVFSTGSVENLSKNFIAQVLDDRALETVSALGFSLTPM